MLIKFKESTDFNDRHYARGDAREFDEKIAQELIDAGVAEAIKEKGKKAVKEKGKKAVTESNVDSSTLTITDLEGNETVVTAMVEPAPVIPLIPSDTPQGAQERATKHGAGYSEKTKGKR